MPGYLVLAERYNNDGIQNLLRYKCIKNDYDCRKTNSTEGSCSNCLPGEDYKNIGNFTDSFLEC